MVSEQRMYTVSLYNMICATDFIAPNRQALINDLEKIGEVLGQKGEQNTYSK